MVISYSRRFIFIHVYKVAGESLAEVLSPYADNQGRFAYLALVWRLFKLGVLQYAALRKRDYFTPLRTSRRLLARAGHAKAKELKRALPRDIFAGFYKFAFVRNPWDWQVSIYHYVLQNRAHPDQKLFASFGSFDNYLEWRIHGKGVELQKEFVLSDSGELLVDFIGHYETLQKDFETLRIRLGIEGLLPHINRSVHKDFREHYTPDTKSLVAEAYKEDIEFFGYAFDEQRTMAPILGCTDAESLAVTRPMFT